MTHTIPDLGLSARLISPTALEPEHRLAWPQLRASNPALYSPYFHIGYTDLIAALRDDVNVLIIEDNQRAIGFLPLQGRNFARPLGDPFTDYHGIIAAPGTRFDLPDLLRQSGIGAYYFDSFIGDIDSHHPDTMPRACAAFDISGNGEAFRSAQDSSYSRHLKGLRRRARKSQSVGDLQIKWGSKDDDVFEQLLRWKRAQYERSGKYDVLGAEWSRAALTRLFKSQTELRADMHALYFGDNLAAIDLGLTDGVTYHSWITAYDPDLSEFSPGMQLLEALINKGEALGYNRIDLGPGLDGYKKYYRGAEGCTPAQSGFVAGRGAPAALSKLYGAAERASGAAGLPGKVRRRYTQIAACDRTLSGRLKGLIKAVGSAPKP